MATRSSNSFSKVLYSIWKVLVGPTLSTVVAAILLLKFGVNGANPEKPGAAPTASSAAQGTLVGTSGQAAPVVGQVRPATSTAEPVRSPTSITPNQPTRSATGSSNPPYRRCH